MNSDEQSKLRTTYCICDETICWTLLKLTVQTLQWPEGHHLWSKNTEKKGTLTFCSVNLHDKEDCDTSGQFSKKKSLQTGTCQRVGRNFCFKQVSVKAI